MGWDDIYPKLSRFPNLRNFFGVTFTESDLDRWTDEEAAKHYIAENVSIVRDSVIAEGKALLAGAVIPWEEIGRAANRYFENENDAKQWLLKVIRTVEKTNP
jgi:hypothetical protein